MLMSALSCWWCTSCRIRSALEHIAAPDWRREDFVEIPHDEGSTLCRSQSRWRPKLLCALRIFDASCVGGGGTRVLQGTRVVGSPHTQHLEPVISTMWLRGRELGASRSRNDGRVLEALVALEAL
jgi:hypothetical protein